MKILHILPRNMMFSRRGATSIDLFVAEIVAASRYSATTRVVAEVGLDGALLSNVVPLDSKRDQRARRLREIIASQAPDVVVVQQHLPTASRLARSTRIPIVLQRHNFLVRKEGRGPLAWIKRLWKLRSLMSLSGVTFVSQATLDAFHRDWPDAKALPTAVIPNGARFDAPRPAERALEILCVGRAAPEKGVLPVVEALSRALSTHTDWFATILLAEGAAHPDYARAIRQAAATNDRISLRYDVPHDVVRSYNARAAIAIVPSMWEEPFGRTALEAHEGGAAVISSGSGGLREISGPYAFYLEKVTAAAIEEAVQDLIVNPSVRQRLADLGHERAKKLFHVRSVAHRLDEFLDGVFQQRVKG